ncbi:MAG: TIM barrel protein [Planctomycetaceae bacterium]|nr:TIM barrel protein [Planctomycetaceae bacterium]
MKKSINLEKIFLEEPCFYERFKLVAEAGFEYAEFGYWFGRDIDRIKENCEKYNVKIASFSADRKASMIIPEERAEFVEYVAESIEVAYKLGCRHLVLHSQAMDENGNFTSVGLDRDDLTKIASAARSFGEAVKLAEAGNVTLVLEAVNNISKPNYYFTTTRQTGNLCRVIDSPRAKILYDIWHCQQMEGNMVATLREYRDVLGYIHVGDCPERHEPGSGEINFDKIKKVVIEELGYDGIWGFELDPAVDSATCVKILAAF